MREEIRYPYGRQRIRKEISARTKASPTKASLSEKLNEIERLHQPDTLFVCLSNSTKSGHLSFSFSLSLSLSLYIYIYIYSLWVANTSATCSNEPSELSEVPNRLSHPPSVDLSNITRAQRKLIKQPAGNAWSSHATEVTIKYRD